MKKTILNVVFACLLTTSLIAQDWNTAVTFSPSQSIKDICWVNETTAYAVSSLYNGTAINVKKTSDGGVTWVEQFAGNTSMNYYEIDTPNNGNDVFIVGNSGTLIHTNDGGENWSNIDVGTSIHLRDIYFMSETVGYIAGDSATILKTIDGGMTWTNTNAVMDGVSTINKVYFITENRGFAAGFNFMYETFDGGNTWAYVPGFEPEAGELFQIQEIQFLTEDVGYISGDVGLLYKTEDQGTTWVNKHVEIPGQAVESLFSFKFLDSNPNIGFACGYHGLLIKTNDAGESWEQMTSDIPGTNENEGPIFHSLDFYNNKGMLTGPQGKILTYEEILSNPDFTSEVSITIYPNPVSEVLSFTAENLSVKEITIFDISGKMVQQIFNPSSNNINCNHLESGTYILSIKTENTIANKLFIKE